jgi:hypothetical protein
MSEIHPASLIEEHISRITMDYECWLFKYANSSEENLKVIREFVNWCITKNLEDLHIPRGRDGTSFFERRQKAT